MSEPAVLPDRIVFRPPPTPRIAMRPPEAVGVLVVPVPGPPGPTGPPGQAQDAVTEPQVEQLIDLAVTAHVQAPAPHPAYDDMPSLVLLLENALA